MSGIQASAAATLEGRPVVLVVFVPAAGGGGFAAGVGLTGSGMPHLEEWPCALSRQLRFLFAFAGYDAPVRSPGGESNLRSSWRRDLRGPRWPAASREDRRADRREIWRPNLRRDFGQQRREPLRRCGCRQPESSRVSCDAD